jgi:2,3-bisphosphoglycerate-independent phosphoglycerate mutase
MRGEIYDKYANPKGIAKLVGMDLMTPDYDIMYANEARAKRTRIKRCRLYS